MSLTDRVLRVMAAVVIIALYYTGQVSGTVATVLLVLAGIFILTSFISFCPLYALFGLGTRKTEE